MIFLLSLSFFLIIPDFKNSFHLFWSSDIYTKKIPISDNLSRFVLNFGGAYRDRTDDPLRARQVLSQLSYGPNLIFIFSTISFVKMVGLNGFEPSTSPLSGVRSNQLSYRPINQLPI